jgi:hypothetical protein
MNRYNQGFGKFGPMEQVWNGKWVKHEDVVLLEKTIKELRQQNSTLECITDDLEVKRLTMSTKCENLFALVCISSLINAVLLFIIVALR